MDRPRRDSRQHNGITVRVRSQPTFATKSALFGHAAVVAERPLLRDERTKLRRGPRPELTDLVEKRIGRKLSPKGHESPVLVDGPDAATVNGVDDGTWQTRERNDRIHHPPSLVMVLFSRRAISNRNDTKW
jgi:hypothetical protein